MIDFTKEELIDIRRCVNPVLIGDAAYPLQEKIQSLIDNYCEHLRRGPYVDDNGHMMVVCMQCNKEMRHEKD